MPAALLALPAAGGVERSLEGHGSCPGQHGTEVCLVLAKALHVSVYCLC